MDWIKVDVIKENLQHKLKYKLDKVFEKTNVNKTKITYIKIQI